MSGGLPSGRDSRHRGVDGQVHARRVTTVSEDERGASSEHEPVLDHPHEFLHLVEIGGSTRIDVPGHADHPRHHIPGVEGVDDRPVRLVSRRPSASSSGRGRPRPRRSCRSPARFARLHWPRLRGPGRPRHPPSPGCRGGDTPGRYPWPRTARPAESGVRATLSRKSKSRDSVAPKVLVHTSRPTREGDGKAGHRVAHAIRHRQHGPAGPERRQHDRGAQRGDRAAEATSQAMVDVSAVGREDRAAA